MSIEAIPRAPITSPGQAQAAGRPAGLGLLLCGLMLAVAWARAFVEMWDRWFPEWKRHGESLHDRLTKGESYYTHAPLVLLTSAVIAFLIYKRVGATVSRGRGAALVGWALLLPFLVLHILMLSAGITFVSGFALIPVLCGLLLIWGGWAMLRAYWLPVVILVFMVPLPEVVIDQLNFALKEDASRAAVWTVNHIFGGSAVLEGSKVYLPGVAWDAPKVLMVEDVCGGLRSLISLTFFASLFALICRARGWWRLVLLLMAVPVAIASNVVRITSLSLVADRWGVAAAGEDSWFHAFSGVAVFAVALAILFLLEQGIVVLGRRLHRPWTDSRLLGYLDHLPRAAPGGRRIWRPAPMLILAVAAVLSLVFAHTPAQARPGWQASEVAPRALTLPGGATWTAPGPDLTLTAKEMEILEYPIYLYRQFRNPASDVPVDVLIVFSANNRKAVHPPDICIKGAGFTVVQKGLCPVAIPGRGLISMRELLAERGDGSALFLYVYKCGNRYTPDFFWQQALVFWNGLAGHFYGSDPAGALIRITVPLGRGDAQPARTLATGVAQVLMPQIDRALNAALHPAR